MDQELAHKIVPYIEQARFPQELIPELRELDVAKHFLDKPYGYGSRPTLQAVILGELARGDMGIALFLAAQLCLLGRTIEKLGSPEQKQKYLPGIVALELLGGWGLT